MFFIQPLPNYYNINKQYLKFQLFYNSIIIIVNRIMKCILLLCLLVAVLSQSYPKQSPVIGIFTQSNDEDITVVFESYISASYVKYVEMSGAQVVPIFAYSTQQQIAALLPKINGVIFPGGDQPIDLTQRWTLNTKFILQWAMKQNDAGRVFPIWAVCLGYQTLAVITSGQTNNMSTLSPVRGQLNVLNTMRFVNPTDRGYIYGDLPDRIITKLTTGQGIMMYDHHWVVSMDTYQQNKNLSSFWKVITESVSPYNERFVALWQARKYPFYGVQYHPEKNSFEWKVAADRSFDAIYAEQVMSNKFIQKARQSSNRFASFDQYQKYSIYNYEVGISPGDFSVIYRFHQTIPKDQSSQNSQIRGQNNIRVNQI